MTGGETQLTEPLLRQVNLNLEKLEPSGSVPSTGAHPIRPSLLLQVTEHAPGALVPDQVTDERPRLGRVQVRLVRERERQLEDPRVLDRLDEYGPAELVRSEGRTGELGRRDVAVRDRGELGYDHRRGRVERVCRTKRSSGQTSRGHEQGKRNRPRTFADHGQLARVGRVVLLGPLDQPLPDIDSFRLGLVPQRDPVAGPEPPERVLARTRALVELEKAPHVALEVLRVLRVDGVRFAFGARRVKERRDEELGEAVEGGFEVFGRDVEKVVGLVHPGKSVRHAGMLRQELGIVVLGRVLPA